MDEALPIDIHYNKLLEWLMSRRHCPQHWPQMVLVVRERINNALQDMPAVEDVARLLHGTYINYFHCIEIVRLLKQTEDNSRNIFGRYSSQRLKDWTDILKLYEKDDIYLAEAAQLLARNVNYEIPTLKRQIAKCVQAQQDYTRKEVEHMKVSADLREQYIAACKHMGIEGKKLKRELLLLVRDLPTTYDDIASRMRTFESAFQYYCSFVAFVLSNTEASKECLPLLRYIIEKGNVTVYEWHCGKQPARVENNPIDVGLDDDEDDKGREETDEIDWGDIGDSTEVTNDLSIDVIDNALTEVEDNTAEIDWSAVDDLGSGIELEDTGDKEHQITVGDVTSDDAVEVAHGVDALSLLDNTTTRNSIVDELMELEMFLEQRLSELSNSASDDVLTAVILQMAPPSLHVDPSAVSAMLNNVRTVLALLTSQRMRDLMLIRSSPRYVDRLTAKLQKLTSDAEKMASMSRLMATRRDESATEQHALEPQLTLIRQKTKELQKQIEGEISKRYKNRRVNVMGEINTV